MLPGPELAAASRMTNSLKHFRLALLALAALTVGCVESSDPSAPAPVGTTGGLHALVVANGVASDITLDHDEAAGNIGIGYGTGGTHVGKELDQNPHPGDAIVVTFTWRGSTNTITDVTDHLEDGTPVGNSYSLVDYTTVNGWSAATYVAINVGGFPYPSPSFDKNLAVHAIFSDQVTEAGELIAAYRGVSPVVAQAIGAHHAATGTGTTTTIADPGAISVNAGAVTYTFTTSTGAPDLTNPANFGWITAAWDSTNKIAAAYALPPAGVVDPQWTWSVQSPNSWAAHVLALNLLGPARFGVKSAGGAACWVRREGEQHDAAGSDDRAGGAGGRARRSRQDGHGIQRHGHGGAGTRRQPVSERATVGDAGRERVG